MWVRRERALLIRKDWACCFSFLSHGALITRTTQRIILTKEKYRYDLLVSYKRTKLAVF